LTNASCRLLIDVFLNTTICQIENRNFGGSMSTIEGPYFLDDAPFANGALKTYHDDRHEPLLMRGKVIDEFGAPIAGAVIDAWHSTPDGHCVVPQQHPTRLRSRKAAHR
jgi:chlorocatechol 1,2-dioxygenase